MIDDGVAYETVSSSNVYAIGYDPESNNLFVVFKEKGTGGPGRKYAFFDVPLDVWDAFQKAPSKGKFLHANVKNKYSYNELQT